MKKALFLIISLFLLQVKALAYVTVLVDFPKGQGWHSVYYETQGDETLLQYVPDNQTEENWERTVIFHSYKNISWTNSAAELMDRTTMQMEMQNPTARYKYLKYTEMDSIGVRCTSKYKTMPAQCEIYRVAKSFEGLIVMHYINKNFTDYKMTYNFWYQLMSNIRIYQSYYRDDRILDKATSFEL